MSTYLDDQSAPSAPPVPSAPPTPSAPPAASTPPAAPSAGQADPERGLRPEHIQDAHRDVLLAVQRGLAANWDDDRPRIAVVEREGIATVYVSTLRTLGPIVRADVRGAVRAALAPYIRLAPYTNVLFLRRGMP